MGEKEEWGVWELKARELTHFLARQMWDPFDWTKMIDGDTPVGLARATTSSPKAEGPAIETEANKTEEGPALPPGFNREEGGRGADFGFDDLAAAMS